jgi:ABC-type transport system substrate-binding protein
LEGQAEQDSGKRAEIYKRCQKLMYDDALLGGMWMGDVVLAFRKELKGNRLLGNMQDFTEAWLDK